MFLLSKSKKITNGIHLVIFHYPNYLNYYGRVPNDSMTFFLSKL